MQEASRCAMLPMEAGSPMEASGVRRVGRVDGPGEVYVLHNCGLQEGLVKIGLTDRTARIRAAELRTTGVPRKFLVLYSQRVSNAREVEKRLHERFAEYRYSDDREFFFISPNRAIKALIREA